MKLYREGTLLRDNHGHLWVITGYCKNEGFPSDLPNAYSLVCLKDGFYRNPLFEMIKVGFEVLSESE